MGMDWPKMVFRPHFRQNMGYEKLPVKRIFIKKCVEIFKIDINTSGKNRTDLPDPEKKTPALYLSSRRGLRPKYFLRKIVKIVKIVNRNRTGYYGP